MNLKEYVPRGCFLPLHNRDKRWAVVVAHRRAGKTVGMCVDLVITALDCPHPRPQVAYLAPFREQAKKVAWEYLKLLTKEYQSKKPNETELKITIHNARGDESTIFVGGADNPDSMRGLYLDAVVLDETGQIRPSTWYSVLRPALSDRKGWAIFAGTPAGRNFFWNMREEARLNPKTHLLLELPASKTGILDEQELADARAAMTEDSYRVEFECDFTAAVPGAFYAKDLDKAQDEGRIAYMERDPEMPVNVVGDLGFTDSCSWWVWQERPNGIAVVDFYEADSRPIGHYIDWIRSLGKVKDVFLPHDARAKSLQTGKSMIETFIANGIIPKLVPELSVLDGIEAARQTLQYTWFDQEKCYDGIEHLRGYSREWDEKNQIYRSRPKHDQHSHAADAFRYLALSTVRRNSQRVDGKASSGLKPQQTQGAHYAFSLEDIWDCAPIKSTRIG